MRRIQVFFQHLFLSTIYLMSEVHNHAEDRAFFIFRFEKVLTFLFLRHIYLVLFQKHSNSNGSTPYSHFYATKAIGKSKGCSFLKQLLKDLFCAMVKNCQKYLLCLSLQLLNEPIGLILHQLIFF